jgi:hypothetical protein
VKNLLLFGIFVIVFTSPSLAQRRPVTGVYVSGENRLDILQIPDHKIKFFLSLFRSLDLHIGQSEGTITLKGNNAVGCLCDGNQADDCVCDDSGGPCIIHFHFQGKEVDVEAKNTDFCDWGVGVAGDGRYLKQANQKPDFNFLHGGADYQVISEKSFFYEDSNLTKHKRAYLLKNDKLLDLTYLSESDVIPQKAIYTEFYDKKHLRLTCGWIAKKGLMRLPGR